MLSLTNQRKKWFTIAEDTSGETRVEILYLKPGEVASIESQANQVRGVPDERGEGFQTEIDYNLVKRTRLYVTKSIVAWEGFTKEDGKPLPCTELNKLKVLKEFAWFGTRIEEFRSDLADEVEEALEDDEKNL